MMLAHYPAALFTVRREAEVKEGLDRFHQEALEAVDNNFKKEILQNVFLTSQPLLLSIQQFHVYVKRNVFTVPSDVDFNLASCILASPMTLGN